MRSTALLMTILAAILASALGTPSMADGEYPTRPIKLVVGFPPGGPTDVIGRLVAKGLEKELSQPVIVENVAGAGGIIAATNVARSAPDGYTLLVGVESQLTRARALYAKVPYDEVKSFTPIRKIAKQRILIVANPNAPFSSLQELIDYAKAHPDELNYGGTIATSSHIGGTLLEKITGAKLTFIGYAGGNQLVTDLMSGTLQVGFYPEAIVGQLIESGKLKMLAVAAAERSPSFPNLPTVQEITGKSMDDFPWFALVGPANLPPAVFERLEKAATQMIASEEFKTRLTGLGASPIENSSAQTFPLEVQEEIKSWGAWAKENKLTAK